MYIYVLLVLVWLFISKKWCIQQINPTEEQKWSLSWKLGIPLFLVMGLRHVCVGSDTEQYLRRYEFSDLLMEDENYQWEKGYNLLNYFFNDICHLDFQWLLLLTSLFLVVVLAKFISRYSANPMMSFYLHLTISIFPMSVSGIRQTIAISICYLAFMLLDKKLEYGFRKKNGIVPLVLILCAYTFHNSSVIFLPILLLMITKVRLNKRQVFTCLLIGSSSIVLKGIYASAMAMFMVSKYEDMNLSTNYASNILVLIIPIAISLFCLLFSKPEADGKFSRKISLMFVLISLTIFFINLQSLNNQLGRLSYYFIFSYIVLIPYAFSTMDYSNKEILKPIILCVCAAYFIVGNMGGIMQIDDYHFFWEDVVWTNRGDAIGY